MRTITDIEMLELTAARDTLKQLKYTYCGGMLWKPPLGQMVQILPLEVKLLLRDRVSNDLVPLLPKCSNWDGWIGTDRIASSAVMTVERNLHLVRLKCP